MQDAIDTLMTAIEQRDATARLIPNEDSRATYNARTDGIRHALRVLRNQQARSV